MNEIYKGPNAEEQESQEGDDQYEQWIKDHPETVTAPENKRECGPEIAEFEAMIVSFESTYSLPELLLIIDLTPNEAPKHPIREPAKNALIPIVALMNKLEKETDITSEKHKELRVKYMRLSRAVGIINRNKVDHNR